jgi:hypothetical protein
MKKASTVLNLLLITLLLASCSSSKQARSYKKTIDGNWQLQTVVTESIPGKFKAQLFNEADFNCFIGSNWSFNDHNSLGTYSINKNGNECAAIKRNIRWTIYEATGEPKLLQFKRLNEKIKEIDDGAGFRFTIVHLDNSTMQLRSDITFEGKPASFVYNFVRN